MNQMPAYPFQDRPAFFTFAENDYLWIQNQTITLNENRNLKPGGTRNLRCRFMQQHKGYVCASVHVRSEHAYHPDKVHS